MISVSTKTGDKGTTGLANGQRFPKTHHIFAVLGGLDELNAVLGQAVVFLRMSKLTQKYAHQLVEIQSFLFYLGAEFAQSPNTVLPKRALTQVEAWVDEVQASLADRWMEKFLLPGGTLPSATVDVARAICRRTERYAWIADQDEAFDFRPELYMFLNRLSDYLYVLRCAINDVLGEEDVPFIRDESEQ